jgi:hypothetical protein
MSDPSSESSRQAASEEQQAQDKVEGAASVQTSQDLINEHNARRQSTLGQQSEPNMERLTVPQKPAPDNAQEAEAESVQRAPQAPAPDAAATNPAKTEGPTDSGGNQS